MNNRNHRAFLTAAARRRQDPPVWDVDGTEFALVVSPHLDQITNMLDVVQTDPPQDMKSLDGLKWKRERLLVVVTEFITPDQRPAFVAMSDDLDVHTLAAMSEALIDEYTGNPTKRSSSSSGSEATGSSSTDGAPPEA